MKHRCRNLFAFLLFLEILLASCVPLPTGLSAGHIAMEDAAFDKTAVAERSAADAAMEFFLAYQASMRHSGPLFGSDDFPAMDLLSSAYIQQLEEIEAGFEGFGFDPVMQTQIAPPDPIEVKKVRRHGSQATVVLQFGRGVIDTPFERSVSLEQIEDQWKIVPDRLLEPVLSPAETVSAFYDWYLGLAAVTGPGNTLTNHAYHDSQYLTEQLMRDVDLLGEAQDGWMFDPFLCAQDIPSSLEVLAVYENAMRPVVVMQSSFPGHTIVLDLVRVNFNRWAIQQISCGRSYSGAAKGFYAWVLGYISGGEEQRSPWVDGAYRDNPYLSKAMLSELDSRLASGKPLEADPVLFSQAIPQSMNSENCPNGQSCAYVHLQYGDATVRQLRVDFQTEEGRPRIVNITPATEIAVPQPAENGIAVTDWALYMDQQYGFGLRFPLQWRLEGLHVNHLMTAQDDPVVRSLTLHSPELPADISSLHIELYVGDAEQVAGLYQLTQPQGTFETNGVEGKLYQTDPGFLLAVLQHPARPDHWVIIKDAISRFPGREQYAPLVAGVFKAVRSSIVFGD